MDYVQSYPKIAKKLLEMMQSNPDEFYKSLVFTENNASRLYEVPVLAHANVDDFVNSLLSLEGENQRTVFYMFQQRYNISDVTPKLLSELPWLKRVARVLNKEIKVRAGKLSGHKIASLTEQCIERAIAILEEAKQKTLQKKPEKAEIA